jgi:hypothetical protein
MPGPRPTTAARRAVVGGLILATLAACSSGPTRGQVAFCRRLQQDRAVLDTPAGSTAAANAQVERFRALDKLAPEAIRDEWHAVTELMALAASTDVGSVDGRNALTEAALAASRPADAVRTYVRDVCGVELTGTVVPSAAPTSTATATTVTAATTDAPGGNPPAPSTSAP